MHHLPSLKLVSVLEWNRNDSTPAENVNLANEVPNKVWNSSGWLLPPSDNWLRGEKPDYFLELSGVKVSSSMILVQVPNLRRSSGAANNRRDSFLYFVLAPTPKY